MDFTPDIIFKYFGQFDKVVVITFKKDSEMFKRFGKDVTGVFYYTKAERTALTDHLKSEKPIIDHNSTKFDILLKSEQSKENLDFIKDYGISTNDILSIFTLDHKNVNKFEIEGIKELEFNTVAVDLNLESPLPFFVDFYESRLKQGELLLEFERNKYAAIKWLVDKKLTEEFYEEYVQDNETGEPKTSVLLHKLKFELELGISKPDEHKDICNKYMNNIKILVEKYLGSAGIKKEDYLNPRKLFWLYNCLLEIGWLFEEEIYLYSNPKIYLDFEGLLHIFLKHTDVFSINSTYIGRSKFPYQLKDIKKLLRINIQKISVDIEKHFSLKEETQFRIKSIYHEGNYFTLSISKNGRIETFHPN